MLSGGASSEESERENFIWLVKTGEFRRFLDVGANVGLYEFIFGSATNDGAVTLGRTIRTSNSSVKPF
jgi:hypothetical protein